MDAAQAVAVAAVFALAGGVKGITGMGLPTVAVSLLGLWMLPAQAAALLVLPALATNLAQCLGPYAVVLARRLWPAWLGLAAVTVGLPDPARLGWHLDARGPLGAVLVAYGAWGLWRPPWRGAPAPVRGLALAVGAATGVVNALTAVFALPLVPWLQWLRLDKEAMVQALGLSFMVATLALAWRLQRQDALGGIGPAGLLATLAAFAGLGLGAALRRRISQAAFQRALYLVFIGLGLANLVRAV